jgi:hypothetical protein
MNKYLVLTSNVGGKDLLLDPKIKYDNCDYFAFVDNPTNLNIWQQFKSYNFSAIDQYTSRRNAKIYKVLSSILFPAYEYIIWQDANHRLKVDPKDIIEKYGDFDLLLFKHPDRNCIYQEMNEIVKRNLDTEENIIRQQRYYLSNGYPINNGLNEMTCFISKNSYTLAQFQLSWWEHICKFSSRDQCSFNFCLWKNGKDLKIKTFSGYANLYAGGSVYFDEIYHLR